MNLPHRPHDPDYLLRRALQANAAFSTLCAAVWILGGEALGRWFGRSGSMAGDGFGLLVFPVVLVLIARRERIPTPMAVTIVVLDLLWVADAGRAIASGTFSTGGSWAMGVIALVVLDFAVLQSVGAHRARQARA